MPEIQVLNDTTFETLMPSGDKVEIGDVESLGFKPHLKLNRWGGECAIDLGLATVRKVPPIVQADKVIWDDGKVACEFIPQPSSEQAKLGGFKFNVILKKKPKTNVSSLNFKAKGLKFYYQPALTPEEIAEGAVRPDNVVGSYAVYHATKRDHILGQTNYKAGKAFHWYRPLIWDSSNPRKEVWGELNVDPTKGIRTVTIPQDFLDSAVYPVTIDNDFGYTEAGGSFLRGSNVMRGGVHTGVAGTGISMTCSCFNSNEKFRLGLYKDSDDSFVIGTNEGKALATQTWVSVDFTEAPTLEAIDYILVVFYGSWDVYVCYDTETDKWYGYESVTYPNWPDTASWTDYSDKVYSIYCTYTPVGGETYNVTAEDGWALGDTSSSQALLKSLVAEGLILSDLPSSLGVLNSTSTDGFTLADIPSRVLVIHLTSSEGLVLADATSVQAVLSSLANDGLELGDLPGSIASLISVASEGLELGDTPYSRAVLNSLSEDGFILSDLSALLGAIYDLLTEDGFNLGDLPKTTALLNTIAIDGLVFTDLVEGTVWFCKLIRISPSRLEIIRLKLSRLPLCRGIRRS